MYDLQLAKAFLQLMNMGVVLLFTPAPSLLWISGFYALYLILLLIVRISSRRNDALPLLFSIDVLFSPLLFLLLPQGYMLPYLAAQLLLLNTMRGSGLGEKLRIFLTLFLLILSPAGALISALFRDGLSLFLAALPVWPLYALILYKLGKKGREKHRDYEYMKSLVDSKNRILSTLTHELRTPLAVIKTSTELVLEERPGAINDTQKTLLSSTLENTNKLNALVENILSQVKVEFSWFSMSRKTLDLKELIRKTAMDIRPFLKTHRQELKFSYPPLLSKISGDERWLQQVLLNLIHNASKNSLEGSTLAIDVHENEEAVVVSVHDQGQGIADHEISHVFNEFYQSRDPSRDLSEGAGLGLTIVKNIIEKHGGRVYISSRPGGGTSVSFTLPPKKGVLSGTHDTGY